ncbi:hypothetical protein JYU34_013330 [Plutella xylostella]|uniref:tRNA (32-2'-O)-methyltransferase regulator THADA n=1 Tax=Plutella xylostella TaxID=51655 RepID=A0ABQ7Q9J7_PLUXY|nr:hypothetical protein JYU34_013330 [Plutella xylostella]
MNGLTLRITGGGSKKHKNINSAINSVEFTPDFQHSFEDDSVFKSFMSSTSAEEQMAKLKNIINDAKELTDTAIRFFVGVFIQAPAKHPIKCFLTRQITRSKDLHKAFTAQLASEIQVLTSELPDNYTKYVGVITTLFTCIENFPPGADSVRSEELKVAEYLSGALKCCVETLVGSGNSKSRALSPTEKNEIFNLAHFTLRLLLYVVQKVSLANKADLIAMFKSIRGSIKHLMFEDDVPMDTKSLSGIVILTMYVCEIGEDSWIHILQSDTPNDLQVYLQSDAGELSLYSAIAIVVPVASLQSKHVQGKPALIALTERILRIGERSSSDTTFTLGVSRTVLQIAKTLEKVEDRALGLAIVDSLLVHIWSHLEHYMDSVRHLAAQTLTCVVKYSSRLRKEGDDTAINNLFTALSSLDSSRKSYYVILTALTEELGPKHLLEKIDGLIALLIDALNIQAVQASATVALTRLSQRSDRTDTVALWVTPVVHYVRTQNVHSQVLRVLDELLVNVVSGDPGVMEFIISHIKQTASSPTHLHGGELKCILMLLSVARKSGYTSQATNNNECEWKGMIHYDVLKQAAIDSLEESTEIFARGDFDFVLYYVKYNINAQSPNFRQLTLSFVKKFMKRLEESYKVLKRQRPTEDETNHSDYYLHFFEQLRRFCFDSLLQGANYSRKFVALQTLVWGEQLNFDGYSRYSAKKYSISLEIADILRQASCVKPTECVSAAYKLKLLNIKLPHRLLQGNESEIPSASTYALLTILLNKLHVELQIASECILTAAANAPMYGLLHCIAHVLKDVDADAISSSQQWSALIADVISTCMRVTDCAAPIVNNSSPEGHLPMDSGVKLGSGQVTAQMVLLCAWRSVKEVSLLLGSISSRLTIEGESRDSTVTHAQVVSIGRHLTTLLAETKHRGAFEQAYVGFNMLLTRLWSCRSESLLSLPDSWLSGLMSDIAEGSSDKLCATRRSAGVPYIIQALVTTELQVNGHPRCFHRCMSRLLALAHLDPHQPHTAAEVETSLNILRALFRNTTLGEAGASYVGEGLLTAIKGFDANTWPERNSSTLLFSALTVRIFGVQRSKDGDNLCVRNKMTGRIFFLRYPQLYDFMLTNPTAVFIANCDIMRLIYVDNGTVQIGKERNSSNCYSVRIFGVQRSKDGDNLCVRNKMTGRIFFLRYPQLYDFMLVSALFARVNFADSESLH